jgi:hypothetical protein
VTQELEIAVEELEREVAKKARSSKPLTRKFNKPFTKTLPIRKPVPMDGDE